MIFKFLNDDMKSFIIDGTNILHKDSSLRSKLKSDYLSACAGLVNMIKAYHNKYHSFKFYIFFDGTVDNAWTNPSGISVVFSDNKSADDLIKQHIKLFCDRKNITLVSSDHELMNFARIHSIDIIKSEDFLKILQPDIPLTNSKSKYSSKSEKPTGCGRKQIKEFMKLFGEE